MFRWLRHLFGGGHEITINTTINDMYHEGHNAGFRIGWAEAKMKYTDEDEWRLAVKSAYDNGYFTAYLNFADRIDAITAQLGVLQLMDIAAMVERMAYYNEPPEQEDTTDASV